MYTPHAKKRSQQRGISRAFVEAVIDYGIEYQRRGGYVYLCTGTSASKMHQNGFNREFAEKCRGIYVVVQDGAVKTVAHKTKRFKH